MWGAGIKGVFTSTARRHGAVAGPRSNISDVVMTLCKDGKATFAIIITSCTGSGLHLEGSVTLINPSVLPRS